MNGIPNTDVTATMVAVMRNWDTVHLTRFRFAASSAMLLWQYYTSGTLANWQFH